jgi:outer membrane cobalamin receptor
MNTRLPAPRAPDSYSTGSHSDVMLPALAVRLAAQSPQEPVRLDDFMVTATRTPVRPSALGSSVDLISGEDLARQQVSSLREALGGTAGMPLFASGATGARLRFLCAVRIPTRLCFWWTACA